MMAETEPFGELVLTTSEDVYAIPIRRDLDSGELVAYAEDITLPTKNTLGMAWRAWETRVLFAGFTGLGILLGGLLDTVARVVF